MLENEINYCTPGFTVRNLSVVGPDDLEGSDTMLDLEGRDERERSDRRR